MKSGPLDQSRFKSGLQIGQTSRLKRRRDLGRRISAQQISATQEARRYIDRYIENIGDISPIFSIYRRYISQKKAQNFVHARVSHVSKFRPKYRPDSDISPIYRRYLPIFGDFSSKRLNVSKIASLAADTRNIADISADISEILVLAPNTQRSYDRWLHSPHSTPLPFPLQRSYDRCSSFNFFFHSFFLYKYHTNSLNFSSIIS